MSFEIIMDLDQFTGSLFWPTKYAAKRKSIKPDKPEIVIYKNEMWVSTFCSINERPQFF